MNCQFCQRKIGRLRQLSDKQFCCRSHRKFAKSGSARAVRDSGNWEPGIEAIVQAHEPDQSVTPPSGGSGVNMILATLACTLLFTAIFLRDGSAAPPPSQSGGHLNQFLASLVDVFPSRGKLQFFEDFRSGTSDWVASSKGPDWSYYAGYVRPSKLKLWQRSANMTDYHFEFVGEIQQHGIGWAYRARDPKNYYASELVLERSGPFPMADIVRYTVLDGKESSRIKLPLPGMMRRDVPYRIRMDVKGSQFTTLVNGSVVDTWSDTRLKSGGVGLFASRGSLATIRSASVAEYGDWISSLFSTAFISVPLV